MLFEVSNRGTKYMLRMYDRAANSFDPRTPEQLGDNFLLDRGFTLVWLSWQFDVPRARRPDAPVRAGGARWQPSDYGPVRSEFVLDRRETSYSVADRDHIPYPVLHPDEVPAGALGISPVPGR